LSFGGEKRRVFAASNALDCDSDLPGQSVRFVPENVARNQVTFDACVPEGCRPGNGGSRASRSMATGGRREVGTSGVASTPSGHHDNDAGSVLGTVQGAALRSARACARPSGLDGACAQMIGGQLRDGRRMLLPSGTHSASMDPLDGIEESSRVFDPFRTRAISPLVEVHFSRF
jgi:hypothetical protein